MTILAINRTPAIVAAEINSIKDQTRTIVLCNSIEIGRRLLEAKAMLEHGEWGKWLKESVDYSQSTSNNLMRIFEEYGAGQTTLFGSNAKSQTLGNLTYSQAVALLGVPEEERETFVEQNDIENMSTRELQKAIKERDQAIKEKDAAKKKLKKAEKTAEKVASELTAMQELKEKLETEKVQAEEVASDLNIQLLQAKSATGTQNQVSEIEEKLQVAQAEIKRLTDELNKPISMDVATVEKIPAEVEKELSELRKKAKQLEGQKTPDVSVLKYRVHFEALTKCFGNLLGTLDEIKDQEQREQYKSATKKLIVAMGDKI